MTASRADARQDRSRSDDSGERPAVSEPVGSAAPARAAATPSFEPPTAAAGTTVAPVRPRSVTVAGKGVIELGASTAPRGRWKGFPISLSLRDAPLSEVLRSFARLAGFNLVLDPRVEGEVTVELKDVPWDQALHVILKTHGMGAEVDGRVWMVEPQ
jgi:type IV pilus assembly protein PilQ